jgi:HEAT repeat protein
LARSFVRRELIAMFGWLRTTPKPPLWTPEKIWIERRMSWLVDRFGVDRLRNAEVVVPSPRFFPDRYGATAADGLAIFRRVCGFMGLDPERFEISFLPAKQHPELWSAAGVYVRAERPKILVSEEQLSDLVGLVATLAHELAHDLLLPRVGVVGIDRPVLKGRTGHLSNSESDHEYVTDLLVVFLGLGVFGANSHIRESYTRFQNWFSWSIGRQGYLSERMYGYALALYSWIRGEKSPPWAAYLRANVRDVHRKGLRYLLRTHDTQFGENFAANKNLPEGERTAKCVAELDWPSSGARLGAIWDLKELGPASVVAVPVLIRRLSDDDEFVRTEAAELLGMLGKASEDAIPALMEAAPREFDLRLARQAVLALGQIGERVDEVVPMLLSLISTPDLILEQSIVTALGYLGPAAAPAVPALATRLSRPDATLAREAARSLGFIGAPAASAAIDALIEALETGEGELPVEAARALGKLDDRKATVALNKALRSRDPELRGAIRGILQQPQAAPESADKSDAGVNPEPKGAIRGILQHSQAAPDSAVKSDAGEVSPAVHIRPE